MPGAVLAGSGALILMTSANLAPAPPPAVPEWHFMALCRTTTL